MNSLLLLHLCLILLVHILDDVLCLLLPADLVTALVGNYGELCFVVRVFHTEHIGSPSERLETFRLVLFGCGLGCGDSACSSCLAFDVKVVDVDHGLVPPLPK